MGAYIVPPGGPGAPEQTDPRRASGASAGPAKAGPVGHRPSALPTVNARAASDRVEISLLGQLLLDLSRSGDAQARRLLDAFMPGRAGAEPPATDSPAWQSYWLVCWQACCKQYGEDAVAAALRNGASLSGNARLAALARYFTRLSAEEETPGEEDDDFWQMLKKRLGRLLARLRAFFAS